MSDVHTLQDSNLYGFWSPKQVYYMWQWKVEIFARNWGWSFKHETSTSHFGWGQLREAQNFFPNDGHFIGHLESLGQEFGQVPVPWNGAWKHGRFETQSLLQRNSENWLNSLTGSLWMVFHEVATWNHMKENWQNSMNSENSDFTCVLISLFQFRSVAPLRVNCSMTEAKWILRKSISDFHTMC